MSEQSELISITELSALTGVNPVTLRAWERRYGLLRPVRSSKGYRLYDAAALERVRQIVVWVEKGVAISRLRELLDRERVVVEQEPDASIELALECLSTLHLRRLEQIFDDWLKHYPLSQVVSLRLQPLQILVQQQPALLAGSLEKILASFLHQKLSGRLLSNLPNKRHPGVLVVVLSTDVDLFALSLAALLKTHQLPVVYQQYPIQREDIALLAAAEMISSVVVVVSPAFSATALEKQLGSAFSTLGKTVWLAGTSLPKIKLRHGVQALHGDALAVAQAIKESL